MRLNNTCPVLQDKAWSFCSILGTRKPLSQAKRQLELGCEQESVRSGAIFSPPVLVFCSAAHQLLGFFVLCFASIIFSDESICCHLRLPSSPRPTCPAAPAHPGMERRAEAAPPAPDLLLQPLLQLHQSWDAHSANVPSKPSTWWH